MQKLPFQKYHRRIFSTFLFLLWFLSPTFTTYSHGKTPLKHSPVASATAGKKIPITVTINDKGGATMVRLYFKTMLSKWYVFLNMEPDGNNRFTATLPSIKNDTKGIDYIILFRNEKEEIIKSRTQRMLILNDYDSVPPPIKPLNVMTEYTKAPPELRDFAVPLRVSIVASQLLAEAQPFTYPPITVPGPATRESGSSLRTLSGIAISIGAGSVGIRYRSPSSQ